MTGQMLCHFFGKCGLMEEILLRSGGETWDTALFQKENHTAVEWKKAVGRVACLKR